MPHEINQKISLVSHDVRSHYYDAKKLFYLHISGPGRIYTILNQLGFIHSRAVKIQPVCSVSLLQLYTRMLRYFRKLLLTFDFLKVGYNYSMHDSIDYRNRCRG